MITSTKITLDGTYHYPPELLELLTDAIPALFKSKQAVIDFFHGAGTPLEALEPWRMKLRLDKNSVKKHEIARSVLRALNEGGDSTLRQRREVIKRVSEFDDFSSCWESDRYKAQGMVAQIRNVVNIKDSFTRMRQEQERERDLRIREQQSKIKAMNERRADLASVRSSLAGLFGLDDPFERGRKLEGVLNMFFKVSGISIRESFVLRLDGQGVVEQIDGVIELDGELYLVEIKWWNSPLSPGDVSQHMVRVFSRGHARGIFISASGYTAAAITSCREALSRTVFVLCGLDEFVLLLEQESDLREFLSQKVTAAILDKNPYHKPLKHD
jgi:restriction system protein